MKKVFVIIVALLLLQTTVALSSSEAKQNWLDAKQESKDKQISYQYARVDFAANNSEQNKQKLMNSGKDTLNAALNEVEAWLNWKETEADENTEVPEELKQQIKQDITANQAKIAELRTDVDGIQNQLHLGLVWLKMVGKYMELLTDVSRNTGKMWAHIADLKIATSKDIEQRLRAGTQDPNAIAALDSAQKEIEKAEENTANAKNSYEEVKIPGQPMIKFSQGNNYIRTAQTHLLSAQRYLQQAYNVMVK